MVDADPVAAARQALTRQLTQLPPISSVKVITDFAPLQIEGTLDDNSPFFFRARHGEATLSITAPGRNPLDPTASTMIVDYERSIDPANPYEALALFTALLTKHGRPPMSGRQAATHITHCCVRHGCKYGDRACPVTLRQRPQRYRCEHCEDDPPGRDVLTFEGIATKSRDLLTADLVLDINSDSNSEFVVLNSFPERVLRPLAGRRLRVTVALADDCPRCGQPLDARPATSRTDNTTSICISCGTEEGLMEANMETLPRKEDWPIHGREEG